MKICFVCTGNTCRSIMAERLMKKHLKKSGLKNVKVFSRGLQATGENIAENAKKVLKKMGASGANRKSVKLKTSKKDFDTLFITMTQSQAQALEGYKVMPFSKLVGQDVPDPYGCDEDVYFEVCQTLDKGVQVLIKKLEEWRKI